MSSTEVGDVRLYLKIFSSKAAWEKIATSALHGLESVDKGNKGVGPPELKISPNTISIVPLNGNKTKILNVLEFVQGLLQAKWCKTNKKSRKLFL
jgi:hypothetical protein